MGVCVEERKGEKRRIYTCEPRGEWEIQREGEREMVSFSLEGRETATMCSVVEGGRTEIYM